MSCNDVLISLVVLAYKIDDWGFRKVTTRSSAIDTCKISRILWPLRPWKITQTLLSFNGILIRVVEVVIICYGTIGGIAERMWNDLCRSCLDWQELVEHLFVIVPLYRDLNCHVLEDAIFIIWSSWTQSRSNFISLSPDGHR